MVESEAGPSTARRGLPSDVAPPAFERWRQSLSQWTGMGLNEEQSAERAKRQGEVKLEQDWNRCEKWKAEIMDQSPIVVFMLKHLKLAGCPFTTSSIQCHPCPSHLAGGFTPEYGVLVCQDRLSDRKVMEDTLAHELLHAFDHCRFNVDWSNLRHHACTEIRAANLSGDCRFYREFWVRGRHAINKQHQVCVKRRAITSVESNPACASREMAEKAVNEVWESCIKDTRPFDEIY